MEKIIRPNRMPVVSRLGTAASKQQKQTQIDITQSRNDIEQSRNDSDKIFRDMIKNAKEGKKIKRKDVIDYLVIRAEEINDMDDMLI